MYTTYLRIVKSKLFTCIVLLISGFFLHACAIQAPAQQQINKSEQTQDDPLTYAQEGIKLHEAGEYVKAISVYKKGLEKYPASTVLHYEMAYSYYMLGKYNKVIELADFIITKNEDTLLEAFSIKSSAQDAMGQLDASIKTFDTAIANFPNNYLLRFNLGVTLFRMGDAVKAEQSFITAIELNPSHAGSHYLLAYISEQANKRVQAILSYYFFLMLENDSERSLNAINSLVRLQQQSVSKNDDNKFSILIDPRNSDTDLASIELAIAMATTSNELLKQGSEQATFLNSTRLLFGILSETKIAEENFWLEFYANFFAKLHQNGHTEAFTHHVYKVSSQQSEIWLNDNADIFNAFVTWLEQ